tara:strand:- start:466 stop:753 length:288 start_codon:yes stop_codon:yes gene_type:complete
MNKIIKAITRLTTVRDDIAKHIVGSMYSMWIILIAYAFLGKTAGIIASILFIILFVLWEVYFMVKEDRPFSITDVLAGVIPMVPFLLMLINSTSR